jgi:hypothetical protein
MHMRVKIQSPVMSMQYHGHTNFCPQVFWIQTKILQGAGNTNEKDRIQLSLMMPGQ